MENIDDFMKKDMELIERTNTTKPPTSLTLMGKRSDVPAINEVNYVNFTGGVLPPHPLSLMTLMADECQWVDLVMRVIGSACSSTEPLFRIITNLTADYKKKARQKDIDSISELLQYPNLQQTGYEMFRMLFENLVLYGNAYLQVIKKRNGEIHSLYTIPPETVRVVPYMDADNVLHFAYVQAIGPKAPPRVFLEDELIHFKTGNSKSFVYGKPLFLPQLTSIAANISAGKAIASWFEQGYTGGAIFKMEAEEETAARNREYIKEYFSKPENFGRTLLLEGEMELIRDGNKFADFDFSKLSDTNRDNIIQAAGVPLSQAGVRSDAGNGNAEIVAAEEAAFVRNTLGMYHKLVYEKLNAKLFRQILGWKDITISSGTPIKFSMSDSIETVRALAESGISPNEVRDLLSMPRLPNEEAGSQYLVATNNGVLPMEKITGINPITGAKVTTVFEEAAAQEKADSLTSGASGTGGSLKKKVEGV